MYQGVQSFWRLRTITDTPTSRIRSAAQGYLELAGTACVHLGQATGPLTGLPCLWYRYSVEERRGSGKNQKWVQIEGGDCPEPFALDDGTGRCIVEPAGAYLKLRRREHWTSPHRDPRNRARGWIFSSGRYRFTEERIEDGDPVYLLGYFETPRRGVAERDRLKRALLRVWKQDPVRMARFDRDGDGMVNAKEWEAVRTEAETLAERSESAQCAKPVAPRVHGSGDTREPYVISSYTEEELASTLRWQIFGATAGSVALGMALVYLLLARLQAS
jgi:hypothetical protein